MSNRGAPAFLRSLAARLGVLAVVFAAVPIILYGQFNSAEDGKRRILLRSLQAEGSMIAQGLRLGIEANAKQPPSITEMRTLMERLAPRDTKMRLLLRPGQGDASLFLIAAFPPLPPEDLERERADLVTAGVIANIPASCDGHAPLDLRYRGRGGSEEVLTSITPFATAAGCFAVITSHSTADSLGSLLGRPYWQASEVRLAAAVYVFLALVVLFLFGGLWRGLRRFGSQARAIGANETAAPSFKAQNRIPELAGVAEEFDRMVAGLKGSAQAFRHAAEDNAHAFKTPIATITQALEPLRETMAGADGRAKRSVQLIEASVARLDALVAASRRLDETNASLVNAPQRKVDLSRLTQTLLESYDDQLGEHGVRLQPRIAPGCAVRGGAEQLETVVENIVENAISFSPRGGIITATLAREGKSVRLTVEDQGPGAPSDVLETMFQRYVSRRPDTPEHAREPHFGIGLWIVERNVDAMGGSVRAENRGAGGLRVIVTLPAA